MQRKKKKNRIGSSIILTIILSSWQSICAIFLATHNLHELHIGQGRSYVEARGPLEIFFFVEYMVGSSHTVMLLNDK